MSFQPIEIAELLEAAAFGIRAKYKPNTPPPPDQNVLVVNDAGLEIIKSSEGLKLRAYQDIVGKWTIGYGHTDNVSPSDVITEDEAEQFLRDDLERFEGIVRNAAVSPSSNEFSAMVSLCYNTGPGNPNSRPVVPGFLTSTLLKQHNAGDKVAAANEFLRWNKARVDGQLVVVRGLTTRRQRERALYLTPDAAIRSSRTGIMAFACAAAAGLGIVGSVAMMSPPRESIPVEKIEPIVIASPVETESSPDPTPPPKPKPWPSITFRLDQGPSGSLVVCERSDPCWQR